MNQYEIRENGQVFTTITARTATAALRKAAKLFARSASAYNLSDGQTMRTTWYASNATATATAASASCSLEVPSRGLRSIIVLTRNV